MVTSGRLSVCPPESASAVTSWAMGKFRLLARDAAFGDEFGQQLLGGRGEELAHDLDPGGLRDDAVRGDDFPVGPAVDAVQAVADDVVGQAQVGRGLDQAHALLDVEVGDRALQVLLVGAVDEVEAVREIA